MGFFSGLDTEAYDREYKDRELLTRIFEYLKPHRSKLFWISFFLIVVASSSASIPLMISEGVGRLAQDQGDQTITILLALVVVAAVVNWGGNWIRRRMTTRVVSTVVMTLQTDAFSSAANHDLSFYDKFSSGRVVSRITSDTREFGQLIVLITDLIAQVMQAIILAVVLARLESRLFLYILGFLPFLFILALAF